MILEFLVRHGLKPLLAAILFALLLSFVPQDTYLVLEEVPIATQNSTTLPEISSDITQEFEEYDDAGYWPDQVVEVGSDGISQNSDVEASLLGMNGTNTTANSTEGNAIPVVDFGKGSMTRDTDYADWLRWFVPEFRDEKPKKDKFLKIVGARSHAVCELIPDPLDFSGGWQSRSLVYLYNSNKTKATCRSFSHPNGEPKLEVIEGFRLYDHLNSTVGKRICTVVFFFSGVCPFSRRAAPLMHSAAIYFPTVRFLAVDTDKFPGVAGHYGIMGVPVVVLFLEKKFLTGWTIPYPDARDTIRAFIMAHSDAKYVKGPLNVTFIEDTILDHFHLRKENDIFYMISYIIILASIVRFFWDRILLDLIKRSLDRSGLDGTPFNFRPQQPAPFRHDAAVPVPVIEPEDDAEL